MTNGQFSNPNGMPIAKPSVPRRTMKPDLSLVIGCWSFPELYVEAFTNYPG